MTWVPPVVLGSVNVLVVLLAWRIRRGATWMLSGYDAECVMDEKRLARWAGNGLLTIGSAGVVVAAAITIVSEYASVILLIYGVGVVAGVMLLARGARKYLRSREVPSQV